MDVTAEGSQAVLQMLTTGCHASTFSFPTLSQHIFTFNDEAKVDTGAFMLWSIHVPSVERSGTRQTLCRE